MQTGHPIKAAICKSWAETHGVCSILGAAERATGSEKHLWSRTARNCDKQNTLFPINVKGVLFFQEAKRLMFGLQHIHIILLHWVAVRTSKIPYISQLSYSSCKPYDSKDSTIFWLSVGAGWGELKRGKDPAECLPHGRWGAGGFTHYIIYQVSTPRGCGYWWPHRADAEVRLRESK